MPIRVSSLVVYSTDVAGWRARSGAATSEVITKDGSSEDAGEPARSEPGPDIDPDDEEEASQLLYYCIRPQHGATSKDLPDGHPRSELNAALRLTGVVKGAMGLIDMFRSDEVEDGPNSRFHVIRSAERKTFTYNPEGSLWLVVELMAVIPLPPRTSAHGSGKRLARPTIEDEWAKVPELYLEELLEVVWKRYKTLNGPIDQMTVNAAREALSRFWSDWLDDTGMLEDVKLQDWLRLSRVEETRDLAPGAAHAIAQLAEQVQDLTGEIVVLRGEQTAHCGRSLRAESGLISFLQQERRRARRRSLAAPAPDSNYRSLGVRPEASTSARTTSGSKWFPSVKIDYTLGLAGLFKVDTGDDLGIGTRRPNPPTKRPSSVPLPTAEAQADNVSISDLTDALQDGIATVMTRDLWLTELPWYGVPVGSRQMAEVGGHWFRLDYRIIGDCLLASVLPSHQTRPASLLAEEDKVARLLAQRPIELDLAHAVSHQTPSIHIDPHSPSFEPNQSWRHTTRRQKDEELMLLLRNALLSHRWQQTLTRTMEDQWIGMCEDLVIKSAKGDLSLSDMDRKRERMRLRERGSVLIWYARRSNTS